MTYPKNRKALIARIEKLQAEAKALQEAAIQLGLGGVKNLGDNGLGADLGRIAGLAANALNEAKYGE